MIENVVISREEPANFLEAQLFYSSVGYFDTIVPDCIVISAREFGQIVGIVRLAWEDNVLVLRGMMVARSHRRRGIGTQMLRELGKHIAARRECFCLPYSWLQDFYGQLGFVAIDDSAAPLHLQERLAANRKKQPLTIVMMRHRESIESSDAREALGRL